MQAEPRPSYNFNPRSREGSDFDNVKMRDDAQISILAPARGATIISHFSPPSCAYFNPRSREGSDPTEDGLSSAMQYFNPRSREGSDES